MKILSVATVLAFVLPVAAGAQSATPGALTAPARLPLDSLKWSGKEGGIQLAPIAGDPMIADRPYSVLLRIPDGLWIRPHWHPREQHATVLGGALRLGGGSELDSTHVTMIRPGDVALIPAEARHYEGGVGLTTVLLYGIGPMTTTFVK